MRRSHYLVIILLLICQTSFGQIYQNMAQPGYKFSRARFDSVLTIPTGLGNLKNISGGQDTGQIRFNKSDSSVYVWNGRAWIKAGGGTIPTLTQVLESAAGANEAGANQIKDLAAGTSQFDAATFGQLTDTANLRLRISDTATMLANYAKTAAVALKLNISDTATMLAPYTRITVSSYGKNATADSTILLLSNGTRYAAKDSVGGGGASGWSLTGNASAVTDFLGTTNNRTMRFRTNNVERMVIDSTGKVGIGTATPTFGLDVNGTARINGATSFLGSYTPPILIGGTTSSGFFLNRRLTSNTVEGTSFRDTLAATANGFNLTGVRITPTFVTGAFTGGTSNALVVSGGNTSLSSVTATSVVSSGVLQANSSGVIIGNFSSPDIEFGNSVIFGRELSAGARLPNTALNDAFLRTNTSAGFAIGDGTTGVKAKFFNSGSLMLKVGGTYTEVASAALNVESTTKGVLIPRMTLTQRNAIASPAAGLQVIVTGETGGEFLSFYNSSTAAWQRVVKLTSAGRLLLGTTTESVYILDVVGLGRFNSDLLVSNNLTVGVGPGSGTAFNTVLGVQAHQNSTSGGWSTAIGYQALRGNINGNFNTAVGSSALTTGGGGSHNTSLGFSSFSNLSSGSNNISLGSQSGTKISGGVTNLTTANNSIFIGYNSFPLGNSQTNQIVIGHAETGLGSNTTIIGNSSTTLTAIRGSLVSGATSVNASAQLEIASTTKGVLFPRMTTVEKLAISTPAAGLQVYDTTLNQMSYYNGTAWVNF